MGLPPVALAMLFFAVTLAPILFAHATGLDPAALVPELGTALGLMAAGLLFQQFLSSGRYEVLSGRLGIDRTMGFHRLAAYALLAAAALHPIVYALEDLGEGPGAVINRLVHLFERPRLRSGVMALAGLGVLVGIGAFRTRLRLPYEVWRGSHSLLAMAVAGLTLHHALTVGTYSPEQPLKTLWLVLAAVAAGAIVLVYVVRPWRMWRQGWKVDSVEQLAPGTLALTLRLPDGERFAFRGGQFIWLTMAPRHTLFHDHPFSIASGPAELPRLQLIIREAGDCTREFSSIAPGTKVAVDGPHGSFTLTDEGRRVAMVAGGVGIAPILGMLEEAAANGDRRPFRLIYAARDPAGLAALDRLEALAQRLDLETRCLVDAGAAEAAGSGHRIEAGPVGAAHIRALAGEAADGTAAYVCGPPAMMETVTDALLAAGVPAAQIHYERFDFGAGRGQLDHRRRRQVLGLLATVVAAMLLFVLH